MGTSDYSPRGAGRPLPTSIEDFSDSCTLTPTGKLLTSKINSIVEDKYKSYVGMARRLAELNIDSPPPWARLEKGGKTLTPAARRIHTRTFGAGAKYLPERWNNISTILHACNVENHDIREIAALWKELRPNQPPDIDGELPDVSQQIRDAENTLNGLRREQTSADTPDRAKPIEKPADQNFELEREVESLRKALDQMLVEKATQQQHIDLLEGRHNEAAQLLRNKALHLEGELRARGIPTPAQAPAGNFSLQIIRNEEMHKLLAAGNAAIGASKISAATDARNRAQKWVSDLRAKLALHRQNTESSYHSAATLLTLAAGPATSNGLAWSKHLHRLSLPGQFEQLFGSSEFSLQGQSLVDRSLSFYLRTFLILSHCGTQTDLPEDLVRLVQDGSLPQKVIIDGFFETKQDVDRINVLLDLIESGKNNLQSKISFDDRNAATIIMPSWPFST